MTIKIEQIQEILAARGYTIVHETKKKRCFQYKNCKPVYVNLQSKSGVTALVAHPESGLGAAGIAAAGMELGANYFHSSNMTRFPKRMKAGENTIPYGIGVTFTTAGAVIACLEHLEENH